jgi:hypothetical protein
LEWTQGGIAQQPRKFDKSADGQPSTMTFTIEISDAQEKSPTWLVYRPAGLSPFRVQMLMSTSLSPCAQKALSEVTLLRWSQRKTRRRTTAPNMRRARCVVRTPRQGVWSRGKKCR